MGDADLTWQRLDERPDVQALADSYLHEWRTWAEHERIAIEVRRIYRILFEIYQRMSDAAQTFEMIVGFGCLSMDGLSDKQRIRRHLAVTPVVVQLDDETGMISVAPPEDGQLSFEDEPLDTSQRPALEIHAELLAELEGLDVADVWTTDGLESLLQRWTSWIGPDADYARDMEPTESSSSPIVAFAPALILRRRSQASLLKTLDQIAEQLESESVPEGLGMFLSAEVGQPEIEQLPPPWLTTEALLPLPANDEQLDLVERTFRQRHLVVQGPPGTGKTHTIANLVCHLLAQGKRTLVTAHTDQALREIKAKIPEPMQTLCVSLTGRSRDETRELSASATDLVERVGVFDVEASDKRVDALRRRLEELRSIQAELTNSILSAREFETRTVAVSRYSGSPMDIGAQVDRDKATHDWVQPFIHQITSSEFPLGADEERELSELFAQIGTTTDLPKPDVLADAGNLLPPEEFSRVLTAEEEAEKVASDLGESKQIRQIAERFGDMPRGELDDLETRVRKLQETLAWVGKRSEMWVAEAVTDMRSERLQVWQTRASELTRSIQQAETALERGKDTDVSILEGTDEEALLGAIRLLLEYRSRDEKVWNGLFRPREVKLAALEVGGTTLVNGRIPFKDSELALVEQYLEALRSIDYAERLWPAHVHVPMEDTIQERLSWLHDEHQLLEQVLTLHQRMEAVPDYIQRDLDVFDPGEVTDVINAIRLARTRSEQEVRTFHLQRLTEAGLKTGTSEGNDLASAVEGRDYERYAAALAELSNMRDLAKKADRRNQLLEKLSRASSGVAEYVWDQGEDSSAAVAEAHQAWKWANASDWLSTIAADNALVDLMQQQKECHSELQEATAALVEELAWRGSYERMTEEHMKALNAYMLALRQLGRGTGKYAPLRRAQAQQYLVDCRDAIPAWVMPLYRVVESVIPGQNAFDVIIIDEASQASAEALMLHYLAPQVIVVGDDKQISPSAVGVDYSELQALQRTHIPDLPYSTLLTNPTTSLFDLAKVHYPRPIRLKEHFRCMPEIIEFSNRIAYPDDPLIPLRQYGLDRLTPIRTKYLVDGYDQGTSSSRINPVEAEAIVDAIEKSLSDPSYDGKTFGVIALTGVAQGQKIEELLLERVGYEEYQTRQMRSGTPYDFQGSERDVILLSMVVAPDAERAVRPLTSNTYFQRFNVAASRAKDQLWLFHSVQLGDLNNPSDVRRQLLEYCLEWDSHPIAETIEQVPNDRRVEPFESLFEQHVFNEIVARRYSVVPQLETYGRRIDLVVKGKTAQLAVECDGDSWHGPDEFLQDWARQRDLERSGWTFWRVRGSDFYGDRERALTGLWRELDRLRIEPMKDFGASRS